MVWEPGNWACLRYHLHSSMGSLEGITANEANNKDVLALDTVYAGLFWPLVQSWYASPGLRKVLTQRPGHNMRDSHHSEDPLGTPTVELHVCSLKNVPHYYGNTSLCFACKLWIKPQRTWKQKVRTQGRVWAPTTGNNLHEKGQWDVAGSTSGDYLLATPLTSSPLLSHFSLH